MHSIVTATCLIALGSLGHASQGPGAFGGSGATGSAVPDAQGILDLGPFERGIVVHFGDDGWTLEPAGHWRELAELVAAGLPDAAHLVPMDSNSSGGLVGWLAASADTDVRSQNADACRSHALGQVKPFVWNGGTLSELDVPTLFDGRALGVNEVGDAVGTFTSMDGTERAFLSWRGAWLDLQSYVAADSEWTLLAAHDVNDDGVVVGLGYRAGEAHLFALHLGTFLPSGGGPLYPPGGGPLVLGNVALLGTLAPYPRQPWMPVLPPCFGLGAEFGDSGGWTCFNRASVSSPWTNVACALSGNAVVASGDPEPTCAPISVVSPRGGSFGLRIGDVQAGGRGHALEATFTPSVSEPNFDFDYALVLQVCPNNPVAQPRFVVEAWVGGTNVYSQTRSATCSDPYFDCTQVNCGGAASTLRNWSCWSIPLGGYIGQSVTIHLEVDDCTLGGHYGYAYVDRPCNPLAVNLIAPAEICEGDPLILDGTNNFQVANHFWSIHEFDANWNPVSAEVMSWFPGPAGIFDISAFAAANGLVLKCGFNYKVKLALPSECVGWMETTKHVKVNCLPPALAGPDRDACYSLGSGATVVTLGDPNAPTSGACDYVFVWKDEQGQIVGSTPTIAVLATSTATYTLTVTEPCTGCFATDTVTVHVLRDDLQVIITPSYFCLDTIPMQMSTWLTASVPGYGGYLATYSWSPSGTGATILAEPPTETTYTVTVTHPGGCVTLSASIVVPAGGVGPLAIPNAFSPNGDGVNDTWNVIHVGMGLGEKPAYDSRAYRLWIFNGWGEQLRYIEKTAAVNDALANGEIEWDGRDDDGVLVILNDVYVYRLELLDCDGNWSAPIIGHIVVLS